jgi:hypothetical protein
MLKMVSQTAKWRSCLSQAVWAPKGASKDPHREKSIRVVLPPKVTKRTDSTPNRTASRVIRAFSVWSKTLRLRRGAVPIPRPEQHWRVLRRPGSRGPGAAVTHSYTAAAKERNEALKQLGVRTARGGDNVDQIAAMVRAGRKSVTSQSTPRVPAVPPKESKEKICK